MLAVSPTLVCIAFKHLAFGIWCSPVSIQRSVNHSLPLFLTNLKIIFYSNFTNSLFHFQTDIVDHNFAVEWMQDFEVFEEALSQDTTYMSSLTRSMSLVLDEFYQNLRTVGVSSMTGAGLDEFLKAVDDAVVEFETQYKPGEILWDVLNPK